MPIIRVVDENPLIALWHRKSAWCDKRAVQLGVLQGGCTKLHVQKPTFTAAFTTDACLLSMVTMCAFSAMTSCCILVFLAPYGTPPAAFVRGIRVDTKCETRTTTRSWAFQLVHGMDTRRNEEICRYYSLFSKYSSASAQPRTSVAVEKWSFPWLRPFPRPICSLSEAPALQ